MTTLGRCWADAAETTRRDGFACCSAREDYFDTLCVVQLKIVQAGPRLHIFHLRRSAVNV